MKARTDQTIICQNGHQAGHFLRDVPDDRNVEAEDLGFSDRNLLRPGDGYKCPQCGMTVAHFFIPDRRWRVFTTSGWIS
jgi:ribosomal protein L34E